MKSSVTKHIAYCPTVPPSSGEEGGITPEITYAISIDNPTLTLAGILLRASMGLKEKIPSILANISSFISRSDSRSSQKSIISSPWAQLQLITV